MRYNMTIYTLEADDIEEIYKRLKGMTYAAKTEECQREDAL